MPYRKVDSRQKTALSKLSDLSSPPKAIFYQGKWNAEIFKNCIGVVGSRRMTDYGRRAIEKIIPQLVADKKTIVSGFMYGVDQYAHQVCVDSGGKTIAVLGWGINFPLTGYDLKLQKQILSSDGLLISEWERLKPALWTFPQRNRIVAALCDEIIIVEAAEQSGSLITARLARELKRKVWAIPGPITSRTSVGTNNLIASGLASIWLDHPTMAIPESPVLAAIESEALTADEIARKLSLPVAQVGAELSMSLLSGVVGERGGKYFLQDVG